MLKYVTAACFGALLLFSGDSSAFPGAASGKGTNAGGDRFAASDTNADGVLVKEEFAKAFPTMKSEAFAIIDADKDVRISRKEWDAFFAGHGAQRATAPAMSGGGAMPPGHPPTGGAGQAPSGPASFGQGVLPVLPIPQKNAPAASGTPTPGELPVLTPPAR